MNINIYSEPFAATGNLAGGGISNLLGRPSFGLLTTVLRESIQNVTDASVGGEGTKVLIRVRTLSDQEREYLSEVVFDELPECVESSKKISYSLEKENLRVLEICDFNTVGLSGPTRADVPTRRGQRPNFVNFIRNVGSSSADDHRGGTYGFGKSSLYAMSECSTILVDTATKTEENVDCRRFIGSHIGPMFETRSRHDNRRFTGRHWWGDTADDIVEPLLDDDAEEIAYQLGMPGRDADDSGTTILIVDPMFASDDDEDIQAEIAEAILWNFWPRMTRTTPIGKRLRVELEFDGDEIEIPEPEDFPPLNLFVDAMNEYRADSPDLQLIASERPKKRLGKLAIVRNIKSERHEFAMREDSIIPDQARHIALMRPVELVVKYLEGNAFPDKRFEWAGVFVSSEDPDVETAFASAEPPAHDDWIPDNLIEKQHQTMVRVGLRQLRNAAQSYVTPFQTSDGGGGGPSLASTASMLGTLLSNTSAEGPGRRPGPQKSPSRPKSLSVGSVSFKGLSIVGGAPCAKYSLDLRNDGKNPSKYLLIHPFFVGDDDREGFNSLGESGAPEVLRISFDNGQSVRDDKIQVGGYNGQVTIEVRFKDFAIDIKPYLLDEEDFE